MIKKTATPHFTPAQQRQLCALEARYLRERAEAARCRNAAARTRRDIDALVHDAMKGGRRAAA